MLIFMSVFVSECGKRKKKRKGYTGTEMFLCISFDHRTCGWTHQLYFYAPYLPLREFSGVFISFFILIRFSELDRWVGASLILFLFFLSFFITD